MYKLFADETLIYDSTIEDYKIDKGVISLELNKSGSFVFSLYPEHFYYDNFVKLKTIITVWRSNKIVFRGRVLNETVDYWNKKVLTCEGELGFLQDSIARPFTFSGTPAELFTKFVEEHNSQIDEFKRFKVGEVTVSGTSDTISRSSTDYDTTFGGLTEHLIEDLGGVFFITHGDDGTDPIPTINYLSQPAKVAEQTVEFGSNLKDYVKKQKAESVCTAIVPLGKDGLTIKDVNDGYDYVYDETAVALYGWIFKTVSYNNVELAAPLLAFATLDLQNIIQETLTVELNAIDLHLLDRSIESFGVGDYVRVKSQPHNFDALLLCNKQTLNLLKPETDSLILGHALSYFTRQTDHTSAVIKKLQSNTNALSSTIRSIEEDYVKNSELSDKVEADVKEYVNSEEGKASIVLSLSGEYVTPTELEGYTKETELSAEIGAYIDTEAGTAKIVNALSGKLLEEDTLDGYVKETELSAEIGAYIDTTAGKAKIISAVSGSYLTESDLKGYAKTTALSTIEQSVDDIEAKITLSTTYSKNTIGTNVRALLQLVSNANSSSIMIKADKIDFDGFTTFLRESDLGSSGSTSIDGGRITTGTISADRIDTDSLKVRRIYGEYTSLTDKVILRNDTLNLYVGGETFSPNVSDLYLGASTAVQLGKTSYYIAVNVVSLSMYPNNNSFTLGTSSNPWGAVYTKKIYIDGEEVTVGSDMAGSLVKMGGSSTYYIQATTSRELCPSSSSTTYPCYLGTTSLYWHYAYIGSNTAKIGSTASSKIAFFAGTPVTRQTLSTTSNNMSYTSATSSNYLYILNNLVGILKNKYGLIA